MSILKINILSSVAVLGSKLGIINSIFVSGLFLIGLGAILSFTIASILNRRAQSHNMRRLERRRDNLEISRRLDVQGIMNRAAGRRRSYLSPLYPPSCSLITRPDLLRRLNATISSLNDPIYGVRGGRVVTRGNNHVARSSNVLVYLVRNSGQ
jgi:hypothetical protein